MRRYKQTYHKQKFSNQKNAKSVRKIPFLLKVRLIFSNVNFFIGFMTFLIASVIAIFHSLKGGFSLIIFSLLILISAMGIIIAFFGLRKTIKWLDILKIGKIAFGIYHRREATKSWVKYMFDFSRADKLYFKYSVDNKKYEAVGETHKTYNLHDEQYEPLLYNPYNPNEAIMVDALPRQVRKILSTEIEKAKSNSNNMIGF